MKSRGYDLKEHSIMINSEFARLNYPELYELMCSHNTLNDREVLALTLDNKLLDILDREFILKIFQSCKMEWELVKENNEPKIIIKKVNAKVHCGICNQPIKYMYFIKNMHTQIELIVGSECIKQYDLSEYTKQEFDKIVNAQKQTKIRIARTQEIDKQFGNVRIILERTRDAINQTEILIPTELENQYVRLWQSANLVVQDYINRGKKFDRAFLLNTLRELKDISHVIDKYVNDKHHLKWVVSRDVFRSIRITDTNIEAYNKLKEHAVFTYDTVYLANQKEFVDNIINDLNIHLKKYQIQIISANPSEDEMQLKYRFGSAKDIYFIVSYSQFVTEYAKLLFFISPKILDISKFLSSGSKFHILDRSQYDMLEIADKSMTYEFWLYKDDNSDIVTALKYCFLLCNNSSYKIIKVDDLCLHTLCSVMKADKKDLDKWCIFKKFEKGWDSTRNLYDTIRRYTDA